MFSFFSLSKCFNLLSSVVLVLGVRLFALVVVIDLAQDAGREGLEGAHVAAEEPGDAAGGAPVVFFVFFSERSWESR